MSMMPASGPGDTSWFVRDRFGMFIHWGTYSLAARHEWVRNIEELDEDTYLKYFTHFDPDLYNPVQWAEMAREAGMKYVVLTTKHHEGFCLWDSKLTDYKVTNTPYGKDLVRSFVNAFRAAGLKIGFYYSLIDWHHPEFPIDGMHPQRNSPQALEINKRRDISKYAEYLHAQVRELLTEYGKVDCMWFDFSYPENEYRGLHGKGHTDWQSEKLLALVRALQPGIIVNNRLDLSNEYVDFYTPEQVQPRTWYRVNGQPVNWELCITFSGSWGYYRDEYTWKSPEQLIQLLVNSVSNGGNLLMNVGPTGRGTFDERAIAALHVYRDWLNAHARSIYGCTASEFQTPQDCRLTQNGKRLYVHVFAWPFGEIYLDGLAGRVEYAQLLYDGSEIKLRQVTAENNTQSTLALVLPVRKPDVVVPVIELFLK